MRGFGSPAVIPASVSPSFMRALPAATVATRKHDVLQGLVSFVPFPNDWSIQTPPVWNVPTERLCRVFLGQIPFRSSKKFAAWLCITFGGTPAYQVERVTTFVQRKGQIHVVPTGCFHVYVAPDAAEGLIAGLHKRVLVDDGGVWVARVPGEVDILAEYCERMKADRRCRLPRRPCGTVVAHMAFVDPRYGTDGQALARRVVPPPSYLGVAPMP